MISGGTAGSRGTLAERTASRDAAKAPLREAMDAVLREHLARLSLVLGITGLVYGVLHFLLMPPPLARPLGLLFAGGVGSLLLALHLALDVWRMPPRWAHPIGALVSGAGIGATLLVMHADGMVLHTIHVLFALVAVSFFFWSTGWVLGLFVYAFGGYVAVALTAEPGREWLYAGVALVASMTIGLLIHVARRRTVTRMVALQVAEQGRAADLAQALHDAEAARAETEAALADAEQARREAQESERRYRLLSEVAFEGILVREGRRIVDVNRAMARMLGYTPDEMVGLDLLDLVPPEQREAAAASMVLEPDGAVEHTVLHKDGTPVHVEVQGRTVQHDGRSVRVLAVRDLGPRREVEQRILMADRLVSMGALAAGVAHEINNPLSYIVGNLAHLDRALEKLAAGSLPAGRIGGLVASVRDARDGAERVRRIVRDLKTFARGDDEPLGAVDLSEVVETAVKLTFNEIRHRAKLVVDTRAVRPVHGNASRLGQVLVNLLMNAAQAIPEGEADRNEIRIAVREDGEDDIVIEVSDTGCGIPTEHAGRIFEPFFTTKPEGQGTGLGLSICHGLVARMGGTLFMESRIGEGTRFWVSLPVSDVPVALEARLTPPQVEGRLAATRILVVDDEPNVGEVIQRSLAEHEVQVARNGREAVARCKEGQFDLILLDLMMPEVTGMEVYERLSREEPACVQRVVFMTGGAFTPRAKAFLSSVPNRCLEKPFDLSELDDLLRGRASVMRAADA